MFLLLLSQLVCAGEVVFDRTGRFGQVQVQVEDEVRTLLIDGSRQSTWRPDQPHRLTYGYVRAIAAAAAVVDTPTGAHVLVIGLGGGTVTRHLRNHYAAHVRAVEIDPIVVRAARRWFDLPRDTPIRVMDGRRAVEHDRHLYALVVVDAASESGVPEHLLAREFLTAIRDRLGDRGVAMANTWAGAPYAEREVATWSAVFGEVLEVQLPTPSEDNRILVAGPGLPTPEALEGRILAVPGLGEADMQSLDLTWPISSALPFSAP